MGDVTTLLREAVPIEDVEPDIDAVTARVRSRRRRRRVATLTSGVAAVVLAGTGAFALVRADDDPTTVVTSSADDRSGVASGGGPRSESPGDPSEFVALLGSRPWLAEVRWRAWPMTPEEFATYGYVPGDAVVVGTLQEVRPAELDAEFCMFIQGCIVEDRVESVIQVDRVLRGPERDQVVVPWKLESIGLPAADQALADRTLLELASDLQATAPIGARVMLFLDLSEDGVTWRPAEPSALVVEDPAGVSIAQPDPVAYDLAMAFDDYVAGVEALLAND